MDITLRGQFDDWELPRISIDAFGRSFHCEHIVSFVAGAFASQASIPFLRDTSFTKVEFTRAVQWINKYVDYGLEQAQLNYFGVKAGLLYSASWAASELVPNQFSQGLIYGVHSYALGQLLGTWKVDSNLPKEQHEKQLQIQNGVFLVTSLALSFFFGLGGITASTLSHGAVLALKKAQPYLPQPIQEPSFAR